MIVEYVKLGWIEHVSDLGITIYSVTIRSSFSKLFCKKKRKRKKKEKGVKGLNPELLLHSFS
jgi:hypothetical protein